MLSLLLPLLPLVSAQPSGPVVTLPYTSYIGNSTSPSGIADSNVTFFGNIRYARPPLGALRFSPPQELDESAPTEGEVPVEDARNWGPPCVQTPAQVGVGDEDCLTLSIWKPTNATSDSKLPVAVYIHGGGFYANSPQGFPLYDWVSHSPSGLIGASITYRLGLLGFLSPSTSSPLITSSSAPDETKITPNNGLLDQRAALEWLQRNVGAFGGDPERVTIYGESAGGASVVMQVVAFGGDKPLPFSGAVAQSIGFGPTFTDAQIQTQFDNATSIIGCPSSSLSETMPCMRNASLSAIVSAINRTPNANRIAPIIDSSLPSPFLPDLPSALLRQGKFASTNLTGAVVAGHTTNDGRTFAGGRPEQFMSEEDTRRLVFSRWPGVSNETITTALTTYYPRSAFATEYDRAWTIAGEIIFTCMDWLFLTAVRNQTSSDDFFGYRWNAPDTVLFNANPYQGAMHTSDLYYLFDGTNTIANAGNTFTPFNFSESLLSSSALAYWTSISTSSSPSTERLSGSPDWLPYFSSTNSTSSANATGLQRMVLTRGDDGSAETKSAMESLSDEEVERCAFWMGAGVTAETRV